MSEADDLFISVRNILYLSGVYFSFLNSILVSYLFLERVEGREKEMERNVGARETH